MANDGIIGNELWKSDGTPENAVLVKDIAVGSNSSYINNMTEMNGILYFTANDVINGTQLWRSDGTLKGTYIVKIISGISNYSGSFPANLTIFILVRNWIANKRRENLESSVKITRLCIA